MTTQKRALFMRVSDETHLLVDKLSAQYEISQTRLVELAVHYLASHEEEALHQRNEIAESAFRAHYFSGYVIEQLVKSGVSIPNHTPNSEEIAELLKSKGQYSQHKKCQADDERAIKSCENPSKITTKTNGNTT